MTSDFHHAAAIARETQWQRRCAWLAALEAGRPTDPGPPEEWQVEAVRKAQEDAWWKRLTCARAV